MIGVHKHFRKVKELGYKLLCARGVNIGALVRCARAREHAVDVVEQTSLEFQEASCERLHADKIVKYGAWC